MKKYKVTLWLVLIGIFLLISAFAAAALDFNSVSGEGVGIIGGADAPTYIVYFFRAHSGIYFILAILGLLSAALGAVFGFAKRK